MSDPFSDDDYKRLQAGGWTQKDRVLDIWYRSLYGEPDEGPSIADLQPASEVREVAPDIVTPMPRQNAWERARPQSHELQAVASRSAAESYRRPCAVCGEPLDPGSARNRKKHKRCANTEKKRRWRSKKKAQEKELKQLLGLEPIEDRDSLGQSRDS